VQTLSFILTSEVQNLQAMLKHIFLPTFLLLLLACEPEKELPDSTKLKQEIVEAEAAFAKMAADKGIAEAFYTFAAEDAVIKRQNDSLIMGRDGIRQYYSAPFYQSAKVDWKPDYVKVSAHGDLAYTYGKFTWTSQDSTGKVNEIKGIFHTVWQRQADGAWKYVWD
jgi:ketosteroid isomerase-like protein